MKSFLNKENEPVRRWLYGSLSAIVAVLAAYGILSSDTVIVWTALLQALLVVPFVETARASVRSTKGTGNDSTENASDSA